MEKKILYSAVVLDDKSHGELLSLFSNIIPNDWKLFAHHLTIVFGLGLPQDLERYLGMTVPLTATKVGISDMAIAVKVDGFQSMNKIPHITLAVNVNQGGKPMMSNNIVDWKNLSEVIGKSTINLNGVVTEVKAN
jgi:hypothetical protein